MKTHLLNPGTPHPLNPNLLFWKYKSNGEHWVLKGEFDLLSQQNPPPKPTLEGHIKRGTPHPDNPNLLFWGYRKHCPNGEYWVTKPVHDNWIRLEKKRYEARKNERSTPEARAANTAAVRRHRERKKAALLDPANAGGMLAPCPSNALS